MNMYEIEKLISDFSEELHRYPHSAKIEERMKELEKLINYAFQNISFLELALCRTKINVPGSGKSNKTYKNETLAQVGDAVLDLSIVEFYFSKGCLKKEIDDQRQKQAKNERLFNFANSKGLRQFCYHKTHFYGEAPGNRQVSANKHDATVEAIIGAIYFDGGLDKAKEWCMEYVLAKE